MASLVIFVGIIGKTRGNVMECEGIYKKPLRTVGSIGDHWLGVWKSY